MRWHRIRLGGSAFEAAAEQDNFLRRMNDWAVRRAFESSKLGIRLRTERAEIYSDWDGDDKVWHLNDTALDVYREVGGSRDVEEVVERVPPGRMQCLLLSTEVFRV